MKNALLSCLILFTQFAFAEKPSNFDKICHQSDVHSFKVDLGQSRSLRYYYRYLKAKDKNAPLVIFIPGGPGATTIGTKDPRPSPEYSLVLTDPRGAGCNDSESVALTDITSEKIADDIVNLIKDLKPTKYVIHGHSFGSIVATILSTKLSQQNVAQPSAIILEGVFGQYWDQRAKTVGLVDAWSKVNQGFSASFLEKLTATNLNPFGLSDNQWIASIYQLSYLGVPAFLPYSSEDIFTFFVNNKRGTSLPEDLNNLVRSVDYNSLPFGPKPWTAIACNELFYADDTDLNMTYSFGKLNYSVTKACAKTVTKPFDAKNWQMKHPTYYFIGHNDPATPLWQGLYHFSSQVNKNKTAIVVKNAGHRSLQLNLRDCMSDIYTSIFDGNSISKTLRKCSAQVNVLNSRN